MVSKTVQKEIIQIHVQFQSNRTSLKRIQQFLQLSHYKLYGKGSFYIIQCSIQNKGIQKSRNTLVCLTIVNRIKYSSAFGIRHSQNITIIPAITSNAIVDLHILKLKVETNVNVQ